MLEDWTGATDSATGVKTVTFTLSDECKSLHSKPSLVFERPLKVYAGSAMMHCEPPRGSVILDLAGGYGSAIVCYGIQIPGVEWPRIDIDWPDHGVPKVGANTWRRLVDGLVAHKSPVYVACMAGHGRTGTTLSILGCLLGAIPRNANPIEYVRQVYCGEAVESVAQWNYVGVITGRDVGAPQIVTTSTVASVDTAWNATKESAWGSEYAPDHMLKGHDACPSDCEYWPKHDGCHKYGHVPEDKLKKQAYYDKKLAVNVSAPLTDEQKKAICQAALNAANVSTSQAPLYVKPVTDSWSGETLCGDEFHDKAWPCDQPDSDIGEHYCINLGNHAAQHRCRCTYTWELTQEEKRARVVSHIAETFTKPDDACGHKMWDELKNVPEKHEPGALHTCSLRNGHQSLKHICTCGHWWDVVPECGAWRLEPDDVHKHECKLPAEHMGQPTERHMDGLYHLCKCGLRYGMKNVKAKGE